MGAPDAVIVPAAVNVPADATELLGHSAFHGPVATAPHLQILEEPHRGPGGLFQRVLYCLVVPRPYIPQHLRLLFGELHAVVDEADQRILLKLRQEARLEPLGQFVGLNVGHPACEQLRREPRDRAFDGGGYKLESNQTIYEYAKQHLKDFPPADAAYHNYKETTDLLNSLAAANPGLAAVSSIGKTYEGRDIWCLRLTSPGKAAKPAALYVANHHAREHLSNEVALDLAAHLLSNKNAPEIKKYLDTLDIYIIPMLNADGRNTTSAPANISGSARTCA